MPYLFRQKHQKLILDCYPPKRMATNVDAKPNKSSLSYLVYYATTRRTKLEKVGNFLVRKTRNDTIRYRIGYLKVTLYIVEELVEKCSDDLGILTPFVLEILQLAISVKDLSVAQLADHVYLTYLEKMQTFQGQIFSSNEPVLRQFQDLSAALLNFGMSANASRTPANTSPVRDDWIRIGLDTANGIADYVDPIYSQGTRVNLIERSVNLEIDTIDDRMPDLDLAQPSTADDTTAADAALGAAGPGADDIPITSAAVTTVKTAVATKPPPEADVGVVALHCLKEFFNTGNKRQVELATRAVVGYSIDKGVDVHWVNKLFILCAKRTHIELRYRIVSTMMVELNHSKSIHTKTYICSLISNLLSSEDVNLVGLPVKDILSGILLSQKSLVLHGSKTPQYEELSAAYLDVVSSLGKHIYYNTQINAMVTEILAFYYHICVTPQEKMATDRFVLLSKIVVCDVEEVSEICTQDAYLSYKKAYYPFSIFNYLYYALALTRDDGTLTVEGETRARIRMAWFHVVQEFYENDSDREHMRTPNAEFVITSPAENPLCLFLDLVGRVSEDEATTEALLNQIWLTTIELVSAFELNFLINFLKFSNSWFESKPGSFKYDYGLLVLQEASKALKETELLNYVGSKLNALDNEGLVPEYFGYAREVNTVDGDIKVSKAKLFELYKASKTISPWLAYTQINADNLDELDAPAVARTPLSRRALSKSATIDATIDGASGGANGGANGRANGNDDDNANATANGNARFASANMSVASIGSVPSPIIRVTSQADMSAAMNQSFARTVSTVRTNRTGVSVRELRSIAAGTPSIAGQSLAATDTSAVGVDVDGAVAQSSIIGKDETTAHKRSGLAYCLTGLDLSSDDEADEAAGETTDTNTLPDTDSKVATAATVTGSVTGSVPVAAAS